MESIHIQVTLKGVFAKAFERFKKKSAALSGKKQNVRVVEEMIRTLPEFEQASNEVPEN